MAYLDIKMRSATDDLSEVDGLLQRVERADGVRPLSDHLWIDLRQGGRPGFAGLLAYIPGHDHLVAYCQVSRGNDSWSLDLIVDPHHRYDMETIGPEMLAAAIDIISNEGGGQVYWWVYEPTKVHQQLASSVNFAIGRTVTQMRVNLPLSQDVLNNTKDIETCAFRVGTDEQSWLDVNNRALATTPNKVDGRERFFNRDNKNPGLVLMVFCCITSTTSWQDFAGRNYISKHNPYWEKFMLLPLIPILQAKASVDPSLWQACNI